MSSHRSGLPAPVYQDERVTLYQGDCRDLLPLLPVGAVVTDPPYGDTALVWDERVDGWWEKIGGRVRDSMWVFGSLRHLVHLVPLLELDGWHMSQEIVWEKHNGSSFHADRFKRVHELAAHFYRGPWAEIYKNPPVTMDATPRQLRRKQRPQHTGYIDGSTYESEDGGPRLMRSVQYVRSEHGRAVHPTQKPLGILRPLISYSVEPGGLVIDPFAGSGSTLLAAREMGRNAIGIEIDPEYCAAAAERLAHLTMEVA